MNRFQAIVGATMMALAAGSATPAAAENVVRWASAEGMPTWDPQGARGFAFNGYRQVYEGLVQHNADLTLVPGLAVSWDLIDPTTWRFVLRQGVTFHDGAPLTAEDVVFSIERARGLGSEVKGPDFAGTIGAAQALDVGTIEVTTTQPDPQLPVKICYINILSKAWAERHGVTAATYYADDHGTYAFDHANGTGPFMLESHEPDRRTVFVRNPHWWGVKLYPHNIDRIEWIVLPDPEARLRLLLTGKIDFLKDVPLEGLERVRATRGLKLIQTGSLTTWGLLLNQARGAPPDANVAWAKPLRDRRVREAIYHAIDAQALCDGALAGLGIPAGSLVVPGLPGYAPELDQRLPYDLAQAKALLTQAGYGAGFDMQLDCRSVEERPCRDLANQLAAVGIRVAVNLLPRAVFSTALKDRTIKSTLIDYDNIVTFGDVDSLRYFHSKDDGDIEGYSYADPEFDALFEQIERENVAYAREGLIDEAWRMILQQDIVTVPLYRGVVVWAMRDNLDLPISPVDTVYFREARLNPRTAGSGEAPDPANTATVH
jgi:peptide/nickel transport system substrate-binding protein